MPSATLPQSPFPSWADSVKPAVLGLKPALEQIFTLHEEGRKYTPANTEARASALRDAANTGAGDPEEFAAKILALKPEAKIANEILATRRTKIFLSELAPRLRPLVASFEEAVALLVADTEKIDAAISATYAVRSSIVSDKAQTLRVQVAELKAEVESAVSRAVQFNDTYVFGILRSPLMEPIHIALGRSAF